jgi:hypothetical protein
MGGKNSGRVSRNYAKLKVLRCTSCGKNRPYPESFYPVSRRAKYGGYMSICKECSTESAMLVLLNKRTTEDLARLLKSHQQSMRRIKLVLAKRGKVS